MNRLLNAVIRMFIQTFLPGIAASLEEEGQFNFQDKAAQRGEVDTSLYIDSEDNGADTTLICFAGMAVLYAAMPKFEFRKTLVGENGRYNFIWVRDIHRTSYNLAPDGSPKGYEFYSRIIGEALAGMKSTRNIAIGASGGGEAAIAFSGVLPIDQVIVFNPAFPLKAYCSREITWRVLFDWKKLLRHPRDYFEVVLVTLSVHYLWKRNCRLVGEENIPDTLRNYLAKNPPAPATVIYSDSCLPDARQALGLKHVPSIKLVPVRSGRHNCMGELKQRGELGPMILGEIAALSANP